jgi:anaerobic selenocysteine-containing dehydrogenase
MDVAVAGGRPKGLFGWQASGAPDRLTTPLMRVDGELREADWDTAMDAVVRRSREVIEKHTPLAMAFYTSGHLFRRGVLHAGGDRPTVASARRILMAIPGQKTRKP